MKSRVETMSKITIKITIQNGPPSAARDLDPHLNRNLNLLPLPATA